MKQPAKKPTIKDLDYRINVITNYLYEMKTQMNDLFMLFDSYIEMKGDVQMFQAYMKSKERKLENDTRRKQSGSVENIK